MKIKRLNNNFYYFLVVFLLLFLPTLRFLKKNVSRESPKTKSGFNLSPVPSMVSSPTPSPTPRPLTFSEMNTLYGPCVYLPTLMYHHVQTLESAKAKNQTGLTVKTEEFRAQMQYLKDKGYGVISMQDLVNFFESGASIPKKSILLTFDDAYQDFYTDAYPILREFGYPASVFVPTGLVNNPDYLTWNEIADMSVNRILFANHTWSHKNAKVKEDILKMEMTTADTQLNEKGLNSPKIFAYPYGLESSLATTLLINMQYKLAFSTRYGGTLCKKQNLDLPRIRVGNGSLSGYGI